MVKLGLFPGRLLDLAGEVFGVEVTAGVQVWEAGALLAAARPAGLPTPGEAVSVRSYAETQGFGAYTPPAAPFPLAPAAHALLYGGPETDWQQVITLLLTRYPATHPLQLAALDDTGAVIEKKALPLGERGAASLLHGAYCILHCPPLEIAADLRGLDGLRWVIARLLGPGGCPWDVRQTHQSLRGALLEETHEVLEALDAGDMPAVGEELGDLLLSIVAHGEMARQAGHFALEDVLEQVAAKLIGRHPHVFGSLAIDGEGTVLRNWEQIKAAELAAKGRPRASVLDGVPPSLPALAAAQKFVKKASRTGFVWESVEQVWAKLREELDELAAAAAEGDADHIREELGDTLFVMADLARWLGLDAETALREANAKFRRRFAHVEAAAATTGRPLAEHSLDELLTMWSEAKRQG